MAPWLGLDPVTNTHCMTPCLLPGSLPALPGQGREPQTPQDKNMSLHILQNRTMSPKPGQVLLKLGFLSTAGVLSQGPVSPHPRAPHWQQAW